LINMQK